MDSILQSCYLNTESRRTSLTKLAAILDQIDSGSVLLPEFQRADSSFVRGAAATTPTLRVLILDGQQRVTSLYGITRGRPPTFFAGMYAAATRKLSAP
jgi:hypothetical protein